MDIHIKWYKQNTTNSITVYLCTTEIKWYKTSGFRAFRISELRIRDRGPLLPSGWRGKGTVWKVVTSLGVSERTKRFHLKQLFKKNLQKWPTVLELL